MKSLRKILRALPLLAGLAYGLSGCVSDGYVATGVYYGPHYHDPWFHEGPWIYGGRNYHERDHYRGGGDVYISPPRPPGLPAPPRLPLP